MSNIFFLLSFILSISQAEKVTTELYNSLSICGDSVFEPFSEECDGTEGCTPECVCDHGYTPDGNGNCIIDCRFQENCIYGCIEPDICEICDVNNGYTHDCQGCANEYIWEGYGVCRKFDMNTTQSCLNFLSNYSNYTTSFESLTEENPTLSTTLKVPTDGSQLPLIIARCSKHVNPASPITYGFWYELRFKEGDKIAIEVDKKWQKPSIDYLERLQMKRGSNTAISIQRDCPEDIILTSRILCEMTNGGTSEYVQSPRLYIHAQKDMNMYLLVHSKYGSTISGDIDIFFTKIVHPCSYFTERIGLNQIFESNFSITLNSDYAVQSMSVCAEENRKGFWFNLHGSNQQLHVSTCNSFENDVTIDMIRYRRSSFYGDDDTNINEVSKVDCLDFEKTECIMSVSGGCSPTSKLTQTVIDLSSEYDYMLFIRINDQYPSEVQVDFTLSCPQDCSDTGVCSDTLGKCECYDGNIFENGFCTSCGNGVLDSNEDCDLSVDGYIDSRCTNKCVCRFGTKPKSINGITKCAVETCGNNIIEDQEECDGGYGCDHCVCVNGTKKYGKARTDCLVETCGNFMLDEGEECDGGDGCIECECQEGWFTNYSVNCKKVSITVRRTIILSCVIVVYCLLFLLLTIIFVYLDIKLKKELIEEAKQQNIFVATIIPLDKTNSMFIDINKENDFIEFSTTTINLNETGKLLPVDERIETEISITNKHKQKVLLTFHNGDYLKYSITAEPVKLSIPPNHTRSIRINAIIKCTTQIVEKFPVTITFGEMAEIINKCKSSGINIEEENSQTSSESCNQNSDSASLKSSDSMSQSKNMFIGSSLSLSQSSSSVSNRSEKSLLQSHDGMNKKRKQNKSSYNKLYCYLEIRAETQLSTKIDGDEIELSNAPIGEGTFGTVTQGRWRGTDVAVKKMKTDLVSVEELKPSFIGEVEMMERLRSPCIVGFIGSVITNDTLCLVTEYYPLGSLRKFMRKNSMSILLKLRFCEDIAKGMSYLHENDIIHQDLKTDNVLVYSKNPSDLDIVRVGDFGTSRSFIESSGKVELQNIGTPVYMAPEIQRKDKMTLKCDVYSFAICMLEIWLGKDPYDPFKFPDSESILKFVGAGKRLDIPEDCLLSDLIEQSWNQEPPKRPSFKEISNAICKIINNLKKKTNQKSKMSESNSIVVNKNTTNDFSIIEQSYESVLVEPNDTMKKTEEKENYKLSDKSDSSEEMKDEKQIQRMFVKKDDEKSSDDSSSYEDDYEETDDENENRTKKKITLIDKIFKLDDKILINQYVENDVNENDPNDFEEYDDN